MAAHISKKLFSFFRELKKNNDREWFQKNKPRYEKDIKQALQMFIVDFGQRLDAVGGRLGREALVRKKRREVIEQVRLVVDNQYRFLVCRHRRILASRGSERPRNGRHCH